MPSRARSLRTFSGLPYVLPSIIILIVIVFAPIFMTLYFSTTDYSLLEAPQFIGLANYVELASDPAFRSALLQTVAYTAIVVPLQTVIAMVLAEVIAKTFRGWFGGFARSVLFVPVLVSLAIAGIAWRFLLDTDFGVINGFLGFFGLPEPNWLGEPGLALLSVALVSVWKNVGYFLVIFYAAIIGVDPDLYEAASIDGAGRFRQFTNITIPALRPVTFLVIVLGTIWSFQVFDLVYTMTGGGPGGATTTIVMRIFRDGFQNYRMGYASAMAVVLLIIVVIVSLVQRRYLGRRQ